MFNLDSKKAILFDFGDTLARTVPTYPDRIRLSLLENGYSFTEKEFFDAYLYADYEIFNNYRKLGNISSKLHQNWLYETLVEKLNINENSTIIKNQVNKTINKINLKRELLDGALDLLDHLKKKGLTLGIISNNDGKTVEKCEEIGIKQYFDIIFDSTKVGIVKPDENIFKKATNELGLKTSQIVHIGDLYGADILGGTNAGLDAIWFNQRNGNNYENLEVLQAKTHEEIIKIFK